MTERNDFLKDFRKRMECVGRFAVLMRNSFDKSTWNNYKIDSKDMQMNILYSVLLFIMECSLKETTCTIDDIAGFLDEINTEYYHLEFGIQGADELAHFIVDTVLGNSGSAQYFTAFNYQKNIYENINVRFIDNKSVYLDNNVKRISYSLTDEGYNMLLSTLELESNLKFSVQEMVFKLHLEKADYNSAVNDIKNIFESLTIQCQKIQSEMLRIRRNALTYSIDDYRKIVEGNMATIAQTREKFNVHRQVIEEKIREFEEQQMKNVEMNDKEKENLNNLKIIGQFLSKVIDEHTRMMSLHFDLKTLYGYELENYSNMTMVKRFELRGELYDKIIADANLIRNLDDVLNPLFFGHPEKIYNPNLALEFQTKIRKKSDSGDDIELGFDENELNREREERARIRHEMYMGCVGVILDILKEKKRFLLSELEGLMDEDTKQRLIPTPEIFREVIIEFLNAGTIDTAQLKKESDDRVFGTDETFELNVYILDIISQSGYGHVGTITVSPVTDGSKVLFNNVVNQYGRRCRLRCSDVSFER